MDVLHAKQTNRGDPLHESSAAAAPHHHTPSPDSEESPLCNLIVINHAANFVCMQKTSAPPSSHGAVPSNLLSLPDAKKRRLPTPRSRLSQQSEEGALQIQAMWIRVWQSRRVTTLPKQELQVPAQIRGAFND